MRYTEKDHDRKRKWLGIIQNALKSFKIVQNLHPRAPVVRLVIFFVGLFFMTLFQKKDNEYCACLSLLPELDLGQV